MKVLSLFDGISCGQIALNRIGKNYDTYYASEIDKYAIQVTQKNYPNTIQLGDINNFNNWDIDWSSIGLVTAGFPCQPWSTSGKQMGDKDDRGKLFWVMLEVIKKVISSNPSAYFLIENVKMKKEFEEYITFHTEQALGKVDKHLINSNIFSAQNRSRYYWTNIPLLPLPTPNTQNVVDILQDNVNDDFYLTDEEVNRGIVKYSPTIWKSGNKMGRMRFPDSVDRKYKTLCSTVIKGDRSVHHILVTNQKKNYQISESKSTTLMARDYKGFGNQKMSGVLDNGVVRMLTPIEYERLQTIEDNYTEGISNTQRYKALGNGWTVDVIAHIFKGML